MNRTSHIVTRSLLVLIVAFTALLLVAQPAMAQSSSSLLIAADVDLNTIVFAICLVLLIPLLTLFILCLSAHRRERERPEDYSASRLAETREKAPKTERRKQPERKSPEASKEAKTALNVAIGGAIFGGLPGIIGIIMGLSAKKKIAQDRRLTGEGTALAAIVTGAVGIVVWAIILVVVAMSFM